MSAALFLKTVAKHVANGLLQSSRCKSSIFPALLDGLPNSLRVFLAVIFVEIRSLDVGWRARVWVVQKTIGPVRYRVSLLVAGVSVFLPLNAGQHSCDIVRRAPSVLQDIEAQFARGIDIGVKHLADELDGRRLVGVLLLEVHHKSEGSIFERGIRRSYYNGIPAIPKSVL